MTPKTADERLQALAGELIGEAFCADWHGDPDVSIREIDRIKKLFIRLLMEFTCNEINLDRASFRSPQKQS